MSTARPPASRPARVAFLTAAIYLIVASLYIWGSDRLLAHVVAGDPRLISPLQTLKGLAFVVVTGALLYVLVWRTSTALWASARAETDRQIHAAHRHALFEHGPDAAMILAEGRIVAANRVAGLLFRCRPEELVGRCPWDVSPPVQDDGRESRDAALDHLGAIRAGEVRRFAWRHRRDDGTEFDAEISLTLLPGTPPHALAWVRDVSAERLARTQLAEANEQLRLLVEGTRHFFFYLQDLSGHVVYVSPTVEAITGRTPAQWVGQSHWFVTDSQANEAAREATRRHLRGEFDGAAIVVEVEHIDGHPVLLEVYEYGWYREGRLVGLQGIAHDVTERVQSEEAVRLSEARYRALAEAAKDSIFILGRDSRVHYINTSGAAQLGLTPESIIGRTAGEVFPAGYSEALRRMVGNVFAELRPENEELPLQARGQEIWLDTWLVPIRRGSGEIEAALGISRDVTERQRGAAVQTALYEIATAAAATTLEALFPAIHTIVGDLMPARNFYIALHDPDLGLLSFPYEVDEFDEPSPPRALGRGLTEYVLRTGQPLLASPEVFDDLVARGEVESVGAPSIDWLGVPLKAQDRVIGVLAVQSYTAGVRYSQEDLAILTFVSSQVAMAIERKRAEEALRESEQRLRDIVEHSTNLFYSHTPDHVLTYVSPQVREFFDCEPEEALIRWTEFATDNPINLAGFEATQRAIDTGQPQPDFELELVGRRGRRIWVSVNEAPVVRDGRTIAIVGALTDITQRRRAEAELRDSEARYRALVQLSPDGIAVHSGGRLVFANTRGARLLGYDSADDLVGRSILDFVHPDFRNLASERAARAQLEGEAQPLMAEKFVRKDGTTLDVEVASMPFTYQGRPAVQVVIRDISERLRVDEHLRQSQRLEAIGRLAGGVAHDFNNLLQALLGTAQVLGSVGSEPGRVRALVGELETHIRRGAALTRQLLLFSRQEVTRSERLDLNTVVTEAAELLRRLVPEPIRIDLETSASQYWIDADRGQLEQVLVNLVVNAADAMPDGGKLTIRTGGGEEGVWFEVVDTGSGMSEQLRKRIFEPFFTTKGAGRGTGLGLSVVDGIVARHHGRIEVASQEGSGSTFRVVLPRGQQDGASREPRPPTATLPVIGDGERLLLVEDEPAALHSLEEMLTLMGFQVQPAASAEEAISVADGEQFDILLSDLLLPGRSGAELADALRRRWPLLRVVMMSGYAEDEATRRGLRDGRVGFLQKPFDMNALARELTASRYRTGRPE
ncbi:MAG: PAS domain S-box protein [Acidobacteriota bacterium]